MTSLSNEEELLQFLYACPVGLIQCDASGEIGMMNPHAMQHLLPLAGDGDPSNLFATLARHAPEIHHIADSYAQPTGNILENHRIVVDLGSSGRSRGDPLVLACTLVKLGVDRLMAVLADISVQVAQERRLHQTEIWFATLFDHISDYAAVTLSPDGTIENANEAFTRQTGHDGAAVVGRSLSVVLGDGVSDADLGIDEHLALATRSGWHLHEGWQQHANGERYWCQRLVVAKINDAAMPSSFSVVLRDVPRHRAVADDLRRLLTCDQLTGAANRMHFSQMLEAARLQWQEIHQPLSLIGLDLDHFKSVNDTHGHPVGDLLLRTVVETCLGLVPTSATFARLGGEEFGLLVPRHDAGQATILAETMRAAIARIEIPLPATVLTVTASFGCATLDETDGCVDRLIALADQRLYAAKREGRNRVHRPRA